MDVILCCLDNDDVLSQRFDNVFIVIILPLVHADISMVIVMLCALRWCAITLAISPQEVDQIANCVHFYGNRTSK